jgi:GLPGLI family protein
MFFLLLLLTGATANAQGVRISYKYLRKTSSTNKYAVIMDMKTDVLGKQSFYYCERKFYQDSLSEIAFDSSGAIVNQKAYALLSTISGGTDDMTALDFSQTKGIQYYKDGINFLAGYCFLNLPEWNLVADTVFTYKGYSCHVAKTDYLGRTWTVWYTEEIPINSGPWFLWGTPGLILYAFDSDKQFKFEFLDITPLFSLSRKEYLEDLYQRGGRHHSNFFNLRLERIEDLHTKFLTDKDFFLQNMGGILVLNEKGGKISELTLPEYIPLIPSNYWKTK